MTLLMGTLRFAHPTKPESECRSGFSPTGFRAGFDAESD
jgi:hypothetical protein